MDLGRYLEVYLQETEELLERLDQGLVELEASPTPDLVAELFRIVHTLKGSSGSMGFNRVMELCHAVEDVLGQMREGNLAVSESLVSWLLSCADAIRALVGEATGQAPAGIEVATLVAAGKAFLPGSGKGGPGAGPIAEREFRLEERERTALREAQARGEHLYRLEVTLGEGCPFKGARALLALRELAKAAEIIRTGVTEEELEDENFNGSFTVLLLSKEDAETLAAMVRDLIPAAELADLRLDAADNLLTLVREGTTTRREGSWSGGNGQGGGHLGGRLGNVQTLRVDVHKLDTLLNLAGELVIQQARMARLAAESGQRELGQVAANLERLSLDIQAAVMKVRMVPLEQVFNRFPRVVRDLARELGREVELVISGAETEVDRTVADELAEPLLHLIRNAVDHGLEPPAERERQGKNPQGRLRLEAFQEGEAVLITVGDDGRGIDPEGIRAKIRELGLYSEEELTGMSYEELVNAIFLAGFSTAKKVSDISGRGVGMDIVRAKVEALGGMVSVTSTPGEGTEFTIRLPLTLAIIRALICQVGPERYAIPVSHIEELVSVRPEEIKTVRGRQVLIRYDQIVPLLSLRTFLGVPEDAVAPAIGQRGTEEDEAEGWEESAEDWNEEEKSLLIAGGIPVVVVRNGQRLTGCVVDQFLSQENIVVKPVGGYLAKVPILAGATILGDGTVVLILDGRSLG